MPLFIDRGDGYEYYGSYRQGRYPDKLGYEELSEAAKDVFYRWACTIRGEKKPRWAIEFLVAQGLASNERAAAGIKPTDVLEAFARASTLPAHT